MGFLCSRIRNWLGIQFPHLEDLKHALFLFKKMKYFSKYKTQKKIGLYSELDLMELNFQASSFLSFYYFVLNSRINGRTVVCYLPWSAKNFKEKVSWFAKSSFLGHYSSQVLIYKFMGVKKFIRPYNIDHSETKIIFCEIVSKIHSLEDILKITIKDVWVGDLIYDQYLRTYRKGTIELDDNEWLDFLHESCFTTLYWINYFHNNDVNSVNVGHTCYFQAIPSRVAISMNIKSFIIMPDRAYYLSRDNFYDDAEYFNYPEIFYKELDSKNREKALSLAKEKLENIFSGVRGVDSAHREVSGFEPQGDQVIFSHKKTNILVSMHCFSDGPNSFGNNLFPDFITWFNYLDKIAHKSEFAWYIKPHPAFNEDDKNIFNELTKGKPWWNIISSSTSHTSILANKVDLVLTMYGTVGFEYAYHGVKVVNASRVNPHIAYKFNLHPESIEEYTKIILDPDAFDIHIDLREIQEYYFMRFIRNTNNIFYKNYDEMIETAGAYEKQWDSRSVFKYTRNNWDSVHDEMVRDNFFEFLENPVGVYRYIPSYLAN